MNRTTKSPTRAQKYFQDNEVFFTRINFHTSKISVCAICFHQIKHHKNK